jgi:hypothetical protein
MATLNAQACAHGAPSAEPAAAPHRPERRARRVPRPAMDGESRSARGVPGAGARGGSALAVRWVRITMSHMAHVVPVRLSETVLQQLEDEAQTAGLSRSEIIRHALAEHFRQRGKDDFRRLTARNRARLAKAGLHSEEDVLAALDD